VSPVDEDMYRDLMAPRRAIWQARAAAKPFRGERKVVYALRRADALARPYGRKLQRCGQRGLRVKCGCKGWRGVRAFTCRQHLTCGSCQRDRARRTGARIRAGLESALTSHPGEMIVLLTLTLRHSGDVDADRKALAAGWRRFYRSLHKTYGKFPYVGVWEVTPGDDGKGHMHMHVAVVWPWRDWGDCRRLWLRACPESERITFVARRRDGRASDPKSVANYLGKYLSKGIDTIDFPRELRTRIVAASYNTRWVFTSRKFWITFAPQCQHCGCQVVSAQYRWRGEPYQPTTDSVRGPPQLELDLAGTRSPRLHG
jgi:hypothetical protein